MQKDSSNEINKIVMLGILNNIIGKLNISEGYITQEELINSYLGPPEVKESEIRSAIEWGIKQIF